MSANGDGDDDGPGRREVAYRLFAAEFEDANLEYSESDEERAPNYVVTPTGGRVNRLFAVGVLTEVEPVSDDVLRGRVVDPTGAFVLYAGQYQQDERAFLDRAEPPAFVAVTGKARTFQPEDSNRVFTSVRPESLSEVDADTRDRWTVAAAEQTIDRVQAMATAIALDAEGDRLEAALVDRGVEAGLADGIVQALAHYGTTPTYLATVRDLAVDAARHVAGDLEEVPGLETTPDATGDVQASDLLSERVEPLGEPADAAATESDTSDDGAPDAETAQDEPDRTQAEAGTETASATGTADSTAEGAASPETEATAESVESATEAATGAETADASEPVETADATETVETADATETVEHADTEPGAETAAPGEATEGGAGPGDFEPGEFDLDEEEREEIEDEYGTEFQSGTEVEDPGEADIETPDPEEVAESGEVTETDATTETAETAGTPTDEPGDGTGSAADEDTAAGENEAGTAAQGEAADSVPSGSEAGDPESNEPETAESDPEPAKDVDFVDAVVDVMADLDEDGGADRETVVETVAERHGADPEAVDDAIQDALMDGRCYEPEDGVLKPI